MAKREPTFEEALKRLEAIVEELEAPEVTLDETLKLFQEGKKLSDTCQKRLAAVEGKITKLMKSAGGNLEEVDFEEGDE